MAQNVLASKSLFKRMFQRILWILLLVGIVGSGVYYFVRTYTLSDGNRSGVLFKISRKGILFKTYEGQLHLGGSIQMTEQSVWNFSAQDARVYEKLQQVEGRNVTVHYREVVNSFPWQGETNYLVDDVQLVQ